MNGRMSRRYDFIGSHVAMLYTYVNNDAQKTAAIRTCPY